MGGRRREHPVTLRRLYRALDAVDVAGDRSEARLVRRLQFVMALASIPTIGSIGALYALGGHREAVVWCLGYCAVTLALVLGVVVTGRFGVLRVPHVLAVGALPSALAIWLGGFASSGAVALWALIVPIAATMFNLRPRTLYFVYAALVLLVVGLFPLPDRAVLSERELNFHFTFNMIGFTGFLFASVRYFVVRIDQEKARAEDLLARVLPAPIVRRLKGGETQIADHLDSVTVVFADIVGFTPLAARLSAAQVVDLLDEVFRRFDELAAAHGVEKIKTIGDAYMAVAGAPERCADHAARAARLALAMREAVRELAAARAIDLSMRIGLHTGEAVAGVIGIQRFAYDLWGDTVNTASRMESHSQPGQIQLTAATRDALGTGFVLRERGPVEVKGRGTIVTYWLDRAA
jgi:guanylate cyclase